MLLLLLLKQVFFLNNEIKDVVMFVSRWTKRHRRALISSNAIIDTIHTTPHQAGWQHCVRQWQLSSHGQTCQPNPCPFAFQLTLVCVQTHVGTMLRTPLFQSFLLLPSSLRWPPLIACSVRSLSFNRKTFPSLGIGPRLATMISALERLLFNKPSFSGFFKWAYPTSFLFIFVFSNKRYNFYNKYMW